MSEMPEFEILRDDEAREVIAAVEDPITKHLLTNAMFYFFRRYNEHKQKPASDFDMLYFVTLLEEIFSNHDVLRRILAGERVGAFFDDE
jgi:hypothetical protein